MKTIVYAVLEAFSTTDESGIIGLYTSYNEAKKQFTECLDADIKDQDEEKLLDEYENGLGITLKSKQEFREHALKNDNYYMDFDSWSTTSIQKLAIEDISLFNPIQIVIDNFKGELSLSTLKELIKLQNKKLAEKLARRI